MVCVFEKVRTSEGFALPFDGFSDGEEPFGGSVEASFAPSEASDPSAWSIQVSVSLLVLHRKS